MSDYDLPSGISGFDRSLMQAYVDGIKPKQIMKLYGIDSNYLSRIREKHKIPAQLELRRQGLLPETAYSEGARLSGRLERERRFDNAIDEYIKNKDNPKKFIGASQIAKKYHISYTRLAEALRTKGVALKQGAPKGLRPSPKADRNAKIVDLVVNQHKTLDDVAKLQNPPISRERVRQILERSGIKIGYRDCIKERIRAEREATRYRHSQEDEIVELLRAGRTPPRRIISLYGVTHTYIQYLRDHFDIPKSKRINWRTDDVIERERQAIDHYYNRPDVTSAWISKNILKSSNPAAVTILVQRRGLPRTRALSRKAKK